MIKTGPIITELASYLNSIEPIARTRHTKKVRPRLNAAISRVFALESNTAKTRNVRFDVRTWSLTLY